MADVSSNLYDWSTSAASNGPSGTATIGTGLDDNLREIQAVVRAGLATIGANIASAGTTDLGAVSGLRHLITGTTTITSFGTVSAGIWKVVVFQGALTLTHNATSLILPSGANITTAAGDVAIVQSEGSGNWRCLSYSRATGRPLGGVIQRAFTSYNTAADISTLIPTDDTIPQSSEGTEILSVAVTPTSVLSRFRCRYQGVAAFVSGGPMAFTAALFCTPNPGGTDAIAAATETLDTAGYPRQIFMEWEFVPGSLSAQTVSVRVGPSSGVMKMNGNNVTRFFGGILRSTLVVEEIAP